MTHLITCTIRLHYCVQGNRMLYLYSIQFKYTCVFVLTISSLLFCSYISMINLENPQLYHVVTICLFEIFVWELHGCIFLPSLELCRIPPQSTSVVVKNKLVRISVENIEGNCIMISWNWTKIQRSRTGYQIHYKNSDDIQIINVRETLTVP